MTVRSVTNERQIRVGDIDQKRLSELIADRLGPALPEAWSIKGRRVAVELMHEGWLVRDVPFYDCPIEEMYFAVLDTVQSEISEETTVAWPHDPARGMHMWEPETRLIGDDELNGWYGSEDDPVLKLEPIMLAELRSK